MTVSQEVPLANIQRMLAGSRWEGDCLIPATVAGRAGYSTIQWTTWRPRKNHHRYAHRAVWWAFRGLIPENKVVDHMCHNRRCINVEHLRLLSLEENSHFNKWNMRTSCGRGHPYTPESTYLRRGQRVCRICQSMWGRGQCK